MRVAYADPPYIGQAKLYKKEASYAGEVDHEALLVSLETYDGWALSASSPSLRVVLRLAPEGTRIGAWVKPFAIFKPNVNPAYAWEPVLFKPARSGGARFGGRKAPTVRDWVSCNITLKKGLCGAKPEAFCFWIFDLLGMRPEDELIDMFPGTGAVTQAWEKYKLEKSE
jgi:hypothetical protein